jgi:small subunit ribosomal protein S17
MVIIYLFKIKVIIMTSAKDAETDSVPKKNTKKAKVKKEKKEKSKSVEEKTKDKDSEAPEKVVKKRRAKAKEIDKTQSKRLVKPKRTVVKKTRKVRVKETPKTQEVKPRNIGVEVTPPTQSCSDQFCPFHGKLSVRGQIINGVVVSSKMNKTAIVQREIRRVIPKYERFEKRTHRYSVHNPECINGQRGDLVKIMECRPLSKSKSFVIIERIQG